MIEYPASFYCAVGEGHIRDRRQDGEWRWFTIDDQHGLAIPLIALRANEVDASGDLSYTGRFANLVEDDLGLAVVVMIDFSLKHHQAFLNDIFRFVVESGSPWTMRVARQLEVAPVQMIIGTACFRTYAAMFEQWPKDVLDATDPAYR
jgi:hypothetical protein